mgnify:CR=1 FL=1
MDKIFIEFFKSLLSQNLLNEKGVKKIDSILSSGIEFSSYIESSRITSFDESTVGLKDILDTVKENAGAFTQGAGLSYREEFNDWRDFILFQSFLDVFRSSDRKVLGEDRKDTRVPVPLEQGILNETKEPNRKKR